MQHMTDMANERPNQFKIMLSNEEKAWLEQVAESRGLTSSDVLRLYIREAHAELQLRQAAQADADDFRWEDWHDAVLAIVASEKEPIAANILLRTCPHKSALFSWELPPCAESAHAQRIPAPSQEWLRDHRQGPGEGRRGQCRPRCWSTGPAGRTPTQLESNMHTLPETFSPDEAPTVPSAHVPESTIALAHRVLRTCKLAIERLSVMADSDAIEAAIGDLLDLKARAQGVLR